jgi:hypothetical protein
MVGPPPPAKTGRGMIVAIIAVLAVLLLLPLLVFVFIAVFSSDSTPPSNAAPSPTTSTVAPSTTPVADDWTRTIADRFSFETPDAPDQRAFTVTLGHTSRSVPSTLYDLALPNEEFYVVPYVLPDTDSLAPDAAALDSELEDIATIGKGTVSNPAPLTIAGHQGRQSDATSLGRSGKCFAFVDGQLVVDGCMFGTPFNLSDFDQYVASFKTNS